MENELVVSGENGIKYTIKVIDIFAVEGYPDKEYIAYTFEEPIDEENIKAYISILKENETDFALLGISDKEEFEVVKNSFFNMVDEK